MKTTGRTIPWKAGSLVLIVLGLSGAVWAQSGEEVRQRAYALGIRAATAAERGSFGEASKLCQEAAGLYRQIDAWGSEAECLLLAGFAEKERKNLETAVELMLEGVKIYREHGPKMQCAGANFLLSDVYVRLDRRAEAVTHLEEALELYRGLRERQKVHKILGRLGELEWKLGLFEKAVKHYEEALDLDRELGGTAERGTLVHNLAVVYESQGGSAQALPLLEEALDMAVREGNLGAQATTLSALGSAYSAQDQYEKALEFFSQAESLYRRLGGYSGLRRVQGNVAKVLVAQGHYDRALTLYETVIRDSQDAGDEDQLARALNSAAVLHRIGGESDRALEYHRKSLDIRRKLGDRAGEAVVLNNLANLEFSQGRQEEALSLLERSLVLRREIGDRDGEAVSLFNSAFLYAQLGRFEEALARHDEALALARSIGSRELIAVILRDKSQILSLMNRFESALVSLDESLAIAREIGNPQVELSTLKARALTLASFKRPGAAEDLERALALSRDLKHRDQEAEVLMILGAHQFATRRPNEAVSSLRASLDIQRDIGVSRSRSVLLSGLGAAYEALHRTDDSIQAYREAVEENEKTLSEIQVDDLVLSFAGEPLNAHGRLAALLARTGRIEEAFAVAEKARSRAFLTQWKERRIDVRRGAGTDLIEEEAALRQRLGNLERELRSERSKPLEIQDRTFSAQLEGEIDRARQQYETLLIRLKQSHPEYSSLVGASPLSLSEVQKLLDDDTVLIEYFVLKDQTLVWIVQRESHRLVRLDLGAERLDSQVSLLRNQIAGRQLGTETAAGLYRALFEPLRPYVHRHNVWIVSHGALHALTFAALFDAAQGKYLVDEYSLAQLPSASALPFVLSKRTPNEGRALVLGNPDGSLPRAAEESRAVAALYGTEPLLGTQATESAIQERSGPIDVLHVAAHAMFDPARPLFSRIELTGDHRADGNLEVHEVFGLDLDGTNLVVLSGCDTALGGQTRGDDLVGWSRAFLYAGAPSVIATLWPIDDAASEALMERFHKSLRQGKTAAEALREAQLSVKAQEPWKAPYFWAAFTLIGDYRGVP